jgi:hypothetical protein
MLTMKVVKVWTSELFRVCLVADTLTGAPQAPSNDTVGSAPDVTASAATRPNPGRRGTGGFSTGVTPIPATTAPTNLAPDIDYFFERGNAAQGTRSICKLCKCVSPFFQKSHSIDWDWPGHLSNRAIWQDNPHAFPKKELPSYSPKTATTGLRRHLTKKHVPEYAQACKDLGWDIHRDPDPDAGPLPAPARDKERESFTSEGLLRHVINFIVADDQVSIWVCASVSVFILISTYQSINVVECPEFRQLLLFLREDLKEEDLPHRDKIRAAIMKAWYTYYKVLKEELQVSSLDHYFTQTSYSENCQCN